MTIEIRTLALDTCRRRVHFRGRSRGRTVFRTDRSWCLLPVLLFLGLRVLAHANPPDPLRVAGIYDGADLDNVLQGVRVPYVTPDDWQHVVARPLHVVGLVRPSAVAPAALVLTGAPRSRGPPG